MSKAEREERNYYMWANGFSMEAISECDEVLTQGLDSDEMSYDTQSVNWVHKRLANLLAERATQPDNKEDQMMSDKCTCVKRNGRRVCRLDRYRQVQLYGHEQKTKVRMDDDFIKLKISELLPMCRELK